jgi:hypothetical protein
MLFVLSILIYRSNDKAIIGKEHFDLVKIVHGCVNNYKYKGNISLEETFGFPIEISVFFRISFFLGGIRI